ncbi:accessory factor UbiK family protein [Candidatus Magnetaquicoccus inordinatus]|uniref:accessory factor UbiK family protein n=1 Tax=Candidatus Magnetaquicoccus inordinatus TaxID=2496818 RepID=UPI00102B7640|nr:accessory factor UbiK family protein [Candidatus Magnetaquicoccus inordinatus]
MQIDNMLLDQITQNILGAFNKVGATREEMTRKVNDIVRDAVERFDLVMRDEFDAAMELLSNTRIKLEQMEKRVAELEAQVASGKSDSSE